MIDPVTQESIQIIEPEQKIKKARLLRTLDFDVLKALEGHIYGKELVKIYEVVGTFNPKHIHYIVEIIACALVKIYGE